MISKLILIYLLAIIAVGAYPYYQAYGIGNAVSYRPLGGVRPFGMKLDSGNSSYISYGNGTSRISIKFGSMRSNSGSFFK